MWTVMSELFFFKQKTAYEVRISDWSSDVCSSDLSDIGIGRIAHAALREKHQGTRQRRRSPGGRLPNGRSEEPDDRRSRRLQAPAGFPQRYHRGRWRDRSEEHTPELQSLMRNSYAVFCMTKKRIKKTK